MFALMQRPPKRTLVFATQNNNKLKEVRSLMPPDVELLSLRDIGCEEELPETGNTLDQNALQKARYVFEKYGVNCFSDDTGLEVYSLGGRPGVLSARFAGPNATSTQNVEKLLAEMQGETDRKARFRTVIALCENGDTRFFEGQVEGSITTSPAGTGGFGYDPVFIPDGGVIRFSEMTAEDKNKISHRGRAMARLAEYLATSK
jgi:XTP/dITP diphosphohydrolase